MSAKVVLTAYHMGHFEYHACPVSTGEVPTRACFDANPLTFVSDTNYGAVPDPNYPERAYIPNIGKMFCFELSICHGILSMLMSFQRVNCRLSRSDQRRHAL